MKIGLVCPYDILRAGGVQEHVLAQAAELRRRGHDVKVITPRPRGNRSAPPEHVIFAGNSTNLKMPTKTTLELGINMKRTLIDDILAAEKFDLLHIHEPEVPVLGIQIIAKANCPVVGTFHSVYPKTPMARTIESFRGPFARSLLTKLSVLTAVSEAAAAFVREQTNKPVEIIPNGIDMDKYTGSNSVQPTKRIILYIGRLEKRKGVKYLLKAYQLLSLERDDVDLVIAGDGHLRVSLEIFTRENKLPRVTFLGFVNEAKKLKLLHSATTFVSPAVYGESFGIVLLEAMAAGLPIVAGDNVGYSELLKDTGQLSIVNPRDVTEFARRLELLTYDTELRRVWQDWANIYVKQFDYSKVVSMYEKLYKEATKP